MKYSITNIDKKGFRRRVAEIAGQEMAYSGVPQCIYTLPGITLERDLTVMTGDGADEGLIARLVAEGLLLAEGAEDVQETETDDAEPNNEDTQETETNADTDNAEGGAEDEQETVGEESEAEEDEEQTEEAEPVIPAISFPLSQHTADSVCNLVFTLYSKGELLTRSTGGQFGAAQELVDALKAKGPLTSRDAIAVIRGAGEAAITGLAFEEDKVVFNGFPATEEAAQIQAWTKLAAAINRACIRQHHVQARKSEEPNEKFAFRTWLTRIGMNGSDLKAERNILYKNLTGHTAFRTPADAEKWKARYGNKRKGTEEDGADE